VHVLIVDDEVSLRRTLRLTLESLGHTVQDVSTVAQGVSALERSTFDLALLDLKLARESGLDGLPRLLHAQPSLGVVIMTAYGALDTAVEAMRRGAFDYLPKPFTPAVLRLLFERWQTVRQLKVEVETLRGTSNDSELSSEAPTMQAVLQVVQKVAPSDAVLLLRGESGTGKGVLARYIHQRSRRVHHPFVTVHGPSLSKDLLESELFGHARGAFTGAVATTDGKVQAADGGTLFLDEIGDLPLELQPKLLRFLQDKTYERVGETQTRSADVRFIAATNRNLEASVKAGTFREDLLYRLNVIEVTLPPLRQRMQDLPRLVQQLLKTIVVQLGKPALQLSEAAWVALSQHVWPGNLRELRNALERGALLANGDVIEVVDLPQFQKQPSPGSIELGGSHSLEEIEAEHLRRILQRTEHLDDAATVLGIDASTLYRKRKKLGL
jgi:two-component system, NtrC family, response regulator AlgB